MRKLKLGKNVWYHLKVYDIIYKTVFSSNPARGTLSRTWLQYCLDLQTAGTPAEATSIPG